MIQIQVIKGNELFIEIDAEELYKFRLNGCIHQHDGNDRGLWYNLKTKELFWTCEPKYANYTFDNPNEIVRIVWISGDNNSQGLLEVCEGCASHSECTKGDILKDVCFREIAEEWYPVNPFYLGDSKEEIDWEII